MDQFPSDYVDPTDIINDEDINEEEFKLREQQSICEHNIKAKVLYCDDCRMFFDPHDYHITLKKKEDKKLIEIKLN